VTAARSERNRLGRGLTEFVTIVVGVLVALAADGWRADLAERRLEDEYLERLQQELEADAVIFARAREAFAAKEAPLSRLLELKPRQIDAEQLAADLTAASRWSWNFPRANSTTFDEMRSTGRLGLIRDTEIRQAVQEYYARYEIDRATMDARRTTFGPLSYELVRRPTVSASLAAGQARSGAWDLVAAADAARIVESFIDRDVLDQIRKAAVAELNYSLYALGKVEALDEAAGELAGRLTH